MALKKPDINKPIFQSGLFNVEAARIQLGWCAVCSEPINEDDFRDSLSKREYSISGTCQCCQDKFFVDDNEKYLGEEEYGY